MPEPALPPSIVRTLLLGALLAGRLAAADGPVAGSGNQAPLPTSQADPTAMIVAEGREIYRRRDLDALELIAARYHHGAFTPADEDQLRHALARILVAREPLLASLKGLPPSVAAGKAGEAYLLDLLDYHTAAGPSAELVPDPTQTPPGIVTGQGAELLPAPSQMPVATEPVPARAATATAPASDAPVLVELPPLVVVRTLPDQVKRSLQLQITLRFADQATSQRIGAQAPIIRDAILGYLDGLANADFLEPKQQNLKQGITAAISSQIPGFPANAVLIPQVDTTRVADDASSAPAPVGGGAGAGH